MRPITALAATSLILLAGPALAEQPVATLSQPTVPVAATPPPTVSPDPVVLTTPPMPPMAPPSKASSSAASDADTDGNPTVAMGPCGPEAVKPDGSLDKAPHGEVTMGVGTHGYNEQGGAVCQPLGDDSAVIISINRSQGDVNFGRR